MIRFLLSLFILTTISTVHGQGIEQFNAANTAYEAENYGEAITQYQNLITSGNMSPEVYHNLGNALAQTQQYGPAMLAYERGLKLQPNHESLLRDKNYLKDVIESDIFEVPAFLPVRLWRRFSRMLPANVWVVFQFLGLGGILFYLSRIWLRPQLSQPTWLKPLKIASIIAVILSTLILASLWYQSNLSESAIVTTATQLYSGPDERSEEIGQIKEGEKVIITEKFGDWMKVELLNLDVGFIMTSDIETI